EARRAPASAAARVRDAPARGRRRPADDPGAARPLVAVDDADVQPRGREAPAARLRPVAPTLVERCFSRRERGSIALRTKEEGLMSTLDERHRTAAAGLDGDVWEDGFARPRVFLQPIAAPSILGLAGFAGATFMAASNLAGWWGSPTSPLVIAPFAAMFGGLAQFVAGMWAYKARDAIATLAHGTWGAFWLGYG